MLGPFCKKHFNIRQFYPIHENPTSFIISQWQKDITQPNLKYLVYRAIVAILFFVTWIISIERESGRGKWPIFLTNWGYTVCTLQALLALGMLSSCVLASAFEKLKNLKENSLKIYPVYWVLYTIATPLAFGITFMYWIVIYDAKHMKFDAMNYFVHGNNSILMMIDLWMISHPIRILHFLYPALFGILYTIFSLLYYLAGGRSRDGTKCIYKIVDWDNPLPTTFTCLGVIVFLICLHTFVFSIGKLKMALHKRRCSKNPDVETKRQAAYVNEGMSNDIV